MFIQKASLIAILLLLISFFNVVEGQSVNVTTTVTPPYPLHLEDIIRFDFGTIVTLNNFSNETLTLKLVASLEGDNGVSVFIKESFVPSMSIQLSPNGNRILTRGDLRRIFSNITENDVSYGGLSRSTLMQTEKLPEGQYQLCIKALDYNTGELLSSESSGCASIFITDYDPPIITYPTTGEYITPKNLQAIMLSWTPSGLAQYTRYKLQIVDMTLNNLMNPNDAFENISIILHYQKQDIFQTSLFYDASKPKLFDGHEYAMRITAYDPTNSLNYKNNGHSEVISFHYKKSNSFAIEGLDISNGQNDDGGAVGPKGNNNYKANSSSLYTAYKGSDGGIYYVTTMEGEGGKEEVVWYGEHPDKGYAHIFHGTVDNNELKGGFTDIPKYKSETSGPVNMEIKDKGKRLVVMNKHQGFLPDELTAINLDDYINWLPPVENNAAYYSIDTANDLTGFYFGSDNGRYYVRHIDDELVIYGESYFAPGTKPAFSRLFKGKFTGKFDKSGKTKTKMYYGFTQYFNKGKQKFYNDKGPDLKESANATADGMILAFRDLNGDVTNLTRKFPSGKGLVPPKGEHKDPIDHKPKAEKSAAFVLFHFGDSPFATLFQNIGTDLNLALDNYDYKVVMKSNYLGLNADKEINSITKKAMLDELKKLALDGYYIDIFVFTHGARDGIMLYDKDVGKSKITSQDIISELSPVFGTGDFPIRMVYQMNCYGSALVEAFIEVGAKVVTGPARVNYLPTQYNKFGELWQAGGTFESSITTASNYWYANSLGATGINIDLKWRIGNPLSWECKSCPLGTSIKDKNDCLACYFKSFWGWEWDEYDYSKTGLGNIYESSRQIIKGNGSITISTIPKW